MLQSVQAPPVWQSHCAAVHCSLGGVPPGPVTGDLWGNYDDSVYTAGYCIHTQLGATLSWHLLEQYKEQKKRLRSITGSPASERMRLK